MQSAVSKNMIESLKASLSLACHWPISRFFSIFFLFSVFKSPIDTLESRRALVMTARVLTVVVCLQNCLSYHQKKKDYVILHLPFLTEWLIRISEDAVSDSIKSAYKLFLHISLGISMQCNSKWTFHLNSVFSLQVPEFRVAYTITTDKLDTLYKKLKPKGVTMTALLAKAAGVALAKHPIMYAGDYNSSLILFWFRRDIWACTSSSRSFTESFIVVPWPVHCAQRSEVRDPIDIGSGASWWLAFLFNLTRCAKNWGHKVW